MKGTLDWGDTGGAVVVNGEWNRSLFLPEINSTAKKHHYREISFGQECVN